MMLLDSKLEIFKMAAILRNFTKTAEALHMTQPNVTQQLRQLEKELGTELFLRNGKRLSLTRAGEILAEECEHLFDAAAHLQRHVSNADSERKHYALGGTLTAGAYIMPALISSFLKTHASVRLSLTIGNTAEITEKLKKGHLDGALVEGPFDRDFFLYEMLMTDEMRFVIRADLAPCGDHVNLQEYLDTGRNLILREPASGTRYYFDLFLEEQKIRIPDDGQILEIAGFEAIKELLNEGYGATVVSNLVVHNELISGKYKSLPFSAGTIRREMNFLYQENETRPFCEEFIRFARRKVVNF